LAERRPYTYKEELANTLSHGFGVILGLVAGYFLLSKALMTHDAWKISSVIIYLFGALASYVTSTLYHGLTDKSRKALLRKFDHVAIFLHIAGTYTPITLVALRQEAMWGWSLFLFIWITTIVGSILSFTALAKYNKIKTLCIVIMGCSVFVAFKPLIEVLQLQNNMSALYWLIAGGVFYIVGAIFYVLANIKYMHTIFHFFVLAGSFCHIVTIYQLL